MAAGKYTLVVDQGSYWSRLFRYLDPDREPYDLTGYTAALQIRPYVESEDVWVALETGDGITINGSEGEILVEMTSVQTGAIENSGVYDIELTPPGGEPSMFLYGKVELNREVTRDDS